MMWGADAAAWRRYSALGLTTDLLPVVSNPNATISARSTLRKLGKTPSRFNHNREAVGIPDWTTHKASARDLDHWSGDADLGICIQTRRLRAIDIDVEDAEASSAIVRKLLPHLPDDPRLRRRPGSGKLLIPFWHEAPLAKHVVPVAGGMVEILGDGQQFIAEGTHESGSRYEWLGEEIATLDDLDFAMLLADLRALATGPVRIARKRQDFNGSGALLAHDPVAEWLVDNWETYDVGQEGQVFIACPFADEHSTESGGTSTAYFPAGSGGYAEGNFVCLHAHCTGRDQAEFLNATGFVAGGFSDLALDPASAGSGADAESAGERSADSSADDPRADRRLQIAEERWPRLTRQGDKIEPTMDNLLRAIAAPAMTGRHIAFDTFRDEIVWAPKGEQPPQWRAFVDTDYAWLRQQLEQRGFKPFGMELLRLAVLACAREQAIDTAREWLSGLFWDGVPRLEQFCSLGWGWVSSPYTAAVGRYVWTALAGRVLDPGCQADMAPILVGPQGIRKSAAILAMVPDPDFYLTIKLDAHDDDSARKLRGKLVVELEELRGINSRAIEEIKAWITKRREEWIPKFREFATHFARRCLFFGDTNEDEFLNDPTGERRWLPGRCVGMPDDRWIAANRDQLWAEGAARFVLDGVDWREAEDLARVEHAAFKVTDAWEGYVAHWLTLEQFGLGIPAEWEYLTVNDVLTGAIGLAANQIDHQKQLRMSRVLKHMGYVKAPARRQHGAKINCYMRPAD